MEYLRENYQKIVKKVNEAKVNSKHGNDVKVLIITKGQTPETLKKLWDLGFKEYGENKVQELQLKADFLPQDIKWHFVGRLQSNKVKYLLRLSGLTMIHSVDSLSLAKKISLEAQKNMRTIDILLQVNIALEKQKYGFQKQDILEKVSQMALLQNIKIKGLMTMAPDTEDEATLRLVFSGLKDLANTIKDKNIPGVEMTELSMGMTQDFPLAIEEGATIIRVGRAIFLK